MFKEGDVLICIDHTPSDPHLNNYLVKGREYVVVDTRGPEERSLHLQYKNISLDYYEVPEKFKLKYNMNTAMQDLEDYIKVLEEKENGAV